MFFSVPAFGSLLLVCHCNWTLQIESVVLSHDLGNRGGLEKGLSCTWQSASYGRYLGQCPYSSCDSCSEARESPRGGGGGTSWSLGVLALLWLAKVILPDPQCSMWAPDMWCGAWAVQLRLGNYKWNVLLYRERCRQRKSRVGRGNGSGVRNWKIWALVPGLYEHSEILEKITSFLETSVSSSAKWDE